MSKPPRMPRHYSPIDDAMYYSEAGTKRRTARHLITGIQQHPHGQEPSMFPAATIATLNATDNADLDAYVETLRQLYNWCIANERRIVKDIHEG